MNWENVCCFFGKHFLWEKFIETVNVDLSALCMLVLLFAESVMWFCDINCNMTFFTFNWTFFVILSHHRHNVLHQSCSFMPTLHYDEVECKIFL